jgi:hypothetical protein
MALSLGVLVVLWKRLKLGCEEPALERFLNEVEPSLRLLLVGLQRAVNDANGNFDVQGLPVQRFESLEQAVRKMAKDTAFSLDGLRKSLRSVLDMLHEWVSSVADLEQRVEVLTARIQDLVSQFGDKSGGHGARWRNIASHTAHTDALLRQLDGKVARLDASAVARSERQTAQLIEHVAGSVAMLSEFLARIQPLFEAYFAQIHGQTRVEEVMGREEAEDVPTADHMESARPPSDATPAASSDEEQPRQMEGPEPAAEEASEDGEVPTQVTAAEEDSGRSSETAVTSVPAPAADDQTPAPGITEDEQAVESASSAPVTSEEELPLEAVSESGPVSVAEDAGAQESVPGPTGQSGTVPASSPTVEHLGQVCFSNCLTF